MEPESAAEYANLLKAFAHPTRLAILAELNRGIRCVSEMEELLPATQANISQHLTILRNARLVDFTQDGGMRCYYLSRPQLVKGVMALLAVDAPVVRKTKAQVIREKAKQCPTAGNAKGGKR